MPFRIHCPNGHELTVEPAHVGRKVRCPACKVVIVVPEPKKSAKAPPPLPRETVQQEAPRPRRRPVEEEVDQLEELEEIREEPPPEEFDEERPRKSKGMKTVKRMRLANLGLGFHYAKVLCIAVAILLFLLTFLLTIFAGMAQSLGMLNVAQITAFLGLVLIAVTPLLGGVGSLLCFWLPAKSNSRVLIIVSFSLEVGGVVLIAVSIIMMLTASAVAAQDMHRGRHAGGGLALAGTGLVMYVIAGLVIYASFILFLIVLRTLALYLRDRATANEAMSQLIKYIVVTLGGTVVWVGMVFALAQAAVGVRAAVGIAVTVGWLVALALSLFGILTVLGTIRQAIATRW